MSAMTIFLIAFACIFGGTFLGIFMRSRLPQRRLGGDTKEVVGMGTGLIATIAGLVLGLLIASANSAYESQNSQVRQLTANIVLLDRTLALYGPEADSLRSLLRQSVDVLVGRIWREAASGSGATETFEASEATLAFYEQVTKLSPGNDLQRSLQTRAIDASTDVAKTRLLLFANSREPIPMPFLVILIAWLTIIFAAFSLFAEHNSITVVGLGICALSAAAAIFLILELGHPFTGLMAISDEPLRNALAPLGR